MSPLYTMQFRQKASVFMQFCPLSLQREASRFARFDRKTQKISLKIKIKPEIFEKQSSCSLLSVRQETPWNPQIVFWDGAQYCMQRMCC